MERQLAAILYADVAGYSRLTGVNEEETHRKLDTGLSLLTDVIVAHGGRKLHEAGDAVLAHFSSVTAAVSAALNFQKQMSNANASVDDSERLEFRVGVNLGEVIRDRDDIYGDGVNVAARIEEVADPGGVCISGAVYEQVAGKIEQDFDDLGHQRLKNIVQPVRVYKARITNPQLGKEGRPAWPHITNPKRTPVATGGCLCRRVRFETWEEPIAVGYCHCRFCQLALGAPLSAWVVYNKTAIRFSGDNPKLYKSSLIAERAFCGNCGTSLFTSHHSPERFRVHLNEACNYG